MKKIFLLGLVFLASCDVSVSKHQTIKASDVKEVMVNTGAYNPWLNVSRIKYGGHSYIMFEGNECINGIVHDPDCKCRL